MRSKQARWLRRDRQKADWVYARDEGLVGKCAALTSVQASCAIGAAFEAWIAFETFSGRTRSYTVLEGSLMLAIVAVFAAIGCAVALEHRRAVKAQLPAMQRCLVRMDARGMRLNRGNQIADGLQGGVADPELQPWHWGASPRSHRFIPWSAVGGVHVHRGFDPSDRVLVELVSSSGEGSIYIAADVLDWTADRFAAQARRWSTAARLGTLAHRSVHATLWGVTAIVALGFAAVSALGYALLGRLGWLDGMLPWTLLFGVMLIGYFSRSALAQAAPRQRELWMHAVGACFWCVLAMALVMHSLLFG